MFGWLKKRFGSVQIGTNSYSYSRLVGLDPRSLETLGKQAAVSDERAARWVMEAMVERDEECTLAGVTIVRAARDKLPPAALCALHGSLAQIIQTTTPTEIRVLVLREQLGLALQLITADELETARELFEHAMPFVVGADTAPADLSEVLLEAAKLAREHRWDRATLALIDRKLTFRNAADLHAARLLVGAALGGGDRALAHFEMARKNAPEDVECHFLLGQAHSVRAKQARSQDVFDKEREKSLLHLEEARKLADRRGNDGANYSGVVLAAASGVALLAVMAPLYDEIMYMETPPKGGGGDGSSSGSSSE
ncbi:MAG: hypothetical protein HOI95_30000 [Chromatiales bacterium]|jgi:hypothetical protein|nr:hypothetical protein [Chromatiales bacterium]